MMKPAVRSKVANGLVIFLLVPRAAETTVEAFDRYSSIFSFAAEDEFETSAGKSNIAVAQVEVDPTEDPSGGDPSGGDPSGGDPSGGDPSGGDPSGGDPSGGDPSGGDPSGGDPSGGDPSGGDPSGGDPSGGDPSGGDPTLLVNAPRELVTAEDGTADLFEVSMQPNPATTRLFHFVSTAPGEATPEPDAVKFCPDGCPPQTIRVIGENDGLVDGDAQFDIEIRDELDYVMDTVPGINFDNDNYPDVVVDILAPASLPQGAGTVFTVFVANVGNMTLSKNDLYIEPTPGLLIKGYAATLLSGDAFKANAKFEDSALLFKNVNLNATDTLMVAVEAVLTDGVQSDQTLTARFVGQNGNQQSDDDHTLRTSVP